MKRTKAERQHERATAKPAPLPANFSAADAAGALRTIVEAELRRVSAARGISETQRRMSFTSLTGIVERLAKLTGEARHVDERVFVRTPTWRRIREAVVEALRPYPDAAANVAKALRLLQGEA